MSALQPFKLFHNNRTVLLCNKCLRHYCNPYRQLSTSPTHGNDVINNNNNTNTAVLGEYNADLFFCKPRWSLNKLFENSNINNSNINSKNNDDNIINDTEIDRLYHLSMLHPPSNQQAKQRIKSMIQWISIIKDIDTDGLTPIYTPLQFHNNNCNSSNNQTDTDNTTTTQSLDNNPILRQDIVNDGNYQQRILMNAPIKDKGYVLVPKTVNLDN